MIWLITTVIDAIKDLFFWINIVLLVPKILSITLTININTKLIASQDFSNYNYD